MNALLRERVPRLSGDAVLDTVARRPCVWLVAG